MRKVLSVMCTVSLLSGCGMFKSPRQEAESLSLPAAALSAAPTRSSETLNLRIIRAGEKDPHLPDPAADLNAERKIDSLFSSGDQLAFLDNVALPNDKNPRELFLVWPEEWQGAKIQSATVEHRLENVQNELIEAALNRPALFDGTTKRWYLPFSEFFSSDSEGADPARQHLLVLDLRSSDGSRKLLNLRMRVTGAVTRLSVSEVPNSWDQSDSRAPGDRYAEIHQWYTSGIKVRVSHLQNSTRRKLRAWVRAENPAFLRVETFLGQQTYHQDESWAGMNRHLSPPYANPIGWQVAVGRLRVSAVRVLAKNPAENRVIELFGKGWVPVDLAPDSKTTLEWLAFPAENQAVCALPPSPVIKFDWWNGISECPVMGPGSGRSCIEQTTTTSQYLPLPWLLTGASISGSWQEGLGFSNPWEAAPLDVSSLSTQSISVGHGMDLPVQARGAPFACQSLF